MKKFIILTILLLSLFLISCEKSEEEKKDNQNDISSLGKEVDTILYTSTNGDEITLNKDMEFYDVLNILGISNPINNKKYSVNAEFQIENENRIILNAEFCSVKDGSLKIVNANYSNSEDVFVMKRFFSTNIDYNENIALSTVNDFNYYEYESDVAIYGFESYSEKISNGREYTQSLCVNTYYQNENYPSSPLENTRMHDIYEDSELVFSHINTFSTYFDQFPENIEIDGVTYNLEQNVIRTFTFYENYILLEQTSPYAIKPFRGVNLENTKDYYKSCLNKSLSFTQKVVYDVNKRSVAEVSLTGNTMSWWYLENLEITIDINIKNFEINEIEDSKKVEDLISYIKSRTTKEEQIFE